MGGGGAIGQALVVLATPVLTRLFTPEDFGVYALYSSTVLVAGSLASLRLDAAVLVPRQLGTAVALSKLGSGALVVVGVVTAAAAAAAVAVGVLGPDATHSPALAALFVLLGVVGFGGYQLLNMWAVRERLYGAVARTRVTRAAVQVAFQVGGGLIGFAPGGLLMGHALGHLFGLRFIGRRMLDAWRSVRTSAARLRWTARRYRNYPLLSAPAALLQSSSLQLPAVVLMAYFGPAAAGVYAVAQRVIATPIQVVGSALAMVFMGETLHLAKSSPAQLRRVMLRSVALTALIGSLPILLLALGGPPLFEFALGREWAEFGTYIRTMAPMFVAQFAMYPISQTLKVLERPGLQLVFDASRLALGVGSLAVAAWLGAEPVTAVLVYSIGMTLSYCVYLALALHALALRAARG